MLTPHERMDPELAQALAAIPKGPGGVFDFGNIEETRRKVRDMARENDGSTIDASVSVDVVEAFRPDNQSSVPLRVLRPADRSKPLPALLWFHGGGQVVGFAAQEDSYLKAICKAVGCAVASVDYRLAPEFPSPAAAEDGFAAFQWLRSEGARLEIDADRIGISGASGGGCIAAATVLMLRDRGMPLPLFQSLNYPMLDDRNESASSYEITDLGAFDRAASVQAWKAVLGGRVGTDDVSWYSAPARAASLARLPPTFIAVGQLDVLRDENVTYATRLVAEGVAVDFHLYAGAYHAWDLFAPSSALTSTFVATWYSFLSRQFRISNGRSTRAPAGNND